MDKRDVLQKVDELALIYDNGILIHPNWYIPPDKSYLKDIHETLFQGKQELRLTIEQIAALLLTYNLIQLD